MKKGLVDLHQKAPKGKRVNIVVLID